MEPDFSGYATKAGLTCTDGRTIMSDAFKHQDKMKVPLVWQHGHTDPENVLGHAILENRPDGVYTRGFFNNSPKAQHARILLEHDDINSLSIYANRLVEKSKRVFQGAIQEVSLVLSGANPGAKIDNVTIRHSDDTMTELEDEAIIYTGLELEHGNGAEDADDTNEENKDDVDETVIEHAEGDNETIQDVLDTLNPKQKQAVDFILGLALESDDELQQDDLGDDADDKDKTDDTDDTDLKEGNEMKHNVFESDEKDAKTVISHDDMEGIVNTAQRTGSLKHAVQEYALSHGITDIDTLFPEAQAINDVPEWIKRRTEWVADFLGAVRKSPFSKIKTLSADLTYEEARAKGYVKGTLKREEFFGVAARTTGPTTVYKKQALDRDDVVDITDFDVIAWLKGEMRLMLDEEIARAALIGDGRDVAHEDKINEQSIRPIATDHELYTTVVNINVGDANSSMNEVVDAVIANRYKLKGTGMPTFYTSEYWLSRFMLVRDGDGHRMYKTVADLAAELRVANVVPVEVMLDEPDLIGIIVNPSDYVMGSTRGGEVSMFDDFDIDYNKQKYLIETRLSGALVKVKAAMVLKRTADANVLASPAVPTFDPETGALTITNTTGVVYKHGATVVNAAGSPYTVDPGDTWVIDATPAAGYYFATSDDDQWSFTADA